MSEVTEYSSGECSYRRAPAKDPQRLSQVTPQSRAAAATASDAVAAAAELNGLDFVT